ncbi:MAG TPA: hypothetical protein VIY48_21605 [Candidatus Paceibacterota bacterium]
MPTETAPANEQELRTELAKVEQQAAIVITNQETYDRAASTYLAVKSWRKSWRHYWYGDDTKPGPITLANRSWKSLLAKFGERDDPAEKLERELGQKILKWDQEQEELRARLQAEAEAKAREEEEARRAQTAFEMEEAGASEEDIEALMEAPIIETAAPVQATYTKAAGVSKRDNWCIEIFDLKALLKLLASGKLKLSAEDSQTLKETLESILKPRAVADKETLNLAGCKAVNRQIPTGRTK